MLLNNPEYPKDGILLIDKEEGSTSHDIVKGIRRIIGHRKVGHAGTLDPFATGLLIILIGQGTKLSPYLMAGKKRYLATVRLGTETDTQDPTGRIINEAPVPELSEAETEKILTKFEGVIEQVPPVFSAVNINGQRAYKLARKGFDVKLDKRRITVYNIGLVDFNLPDLTIDVSCSPGTYIRSLAYDIGRQLGSGAHLKKLRRVSSGSFKIKDAFAWKDFKSSIGGGFKKEIIPLKEALPDMPGIKIDDGIAGRIKNGYRPSREYLTEKCELPDTFTGNLKLFSKSSLVAVLEIEGFEERGNKWLKKIRVFN